MNFEIGDSICIKNTKGKLKYAFITSVTRDLEFYYYIFFKGKESSYKIDCKENVFSKKALLIEKNNI